MNQMNRRRLEDVPYVYKDMVKGTPPWTTYLLLAILLALLTGVSGYGIYRFLRRRREQQAFDQLTNGAKDMTQELQPEEDVHTRQQELGKYPPWTSINNPRTTAPTATTTATQESNKSEYVCMVEDSPTGGISV